MKKTKTRKPVGEGCATIDFSRPKYKLAAEAFLRKREQIIANNYPGFEPLGSDVLARALIDADPGSPDKPTKPS